MFEYCIVFIFTKLHPFNNFGVARHNIFKHGWCIWKKIQTFKLLHGRMMFEKMTVNGCAD